MKSEWKHLKLQWRIYWYDRKQTKNLGQIMSLKDDPIGIRY